MQIFALVGKSGTGKSFQCMDIARNHHIEAVIDDGLLISRSRILAGNSAKHESNKMASVKRAIFSSDIHAEAVKSAISKYNLSSILILGTSDKMVREIARRLNLPEVQQTFYIEDISSPEEIFIASEMRNKQGKHIIPVPVFEVKKQFSGYVLSALLPYGKRDRQLEKTVVRPTYSYLGEFRISQKVFNDICRFETSRIPNVNNVFKVKSTSDIEGYISIDIDISFSFPCEIQKTCTKIQKAIIKSIEDSTSIIVKEVNVFVKQLENL